MQLNLLEQTEVLTVVALVGRLDSPGVDQVEVRFHAALGARRDAIVDLSGVEFLSSLGVRMLIAAAKTLARNGRRLVLVAPQPLVNGALRHTAIDSILPVREELASARALCTSA